MNINDIKHFEYGKGIRFFINDIKCTLMKTRNGDQDVIDLSVLLTDSKNNHWEGEVILFEDTDEGSAYASLLEGFAETYPDKVKDGNIDESDMKGTSGICDAWQDKRSYRHLTNFKFDVPAPIASDVITNFDDEGDI